MEFSVAKMSTLSFNVRQKTLNVEPLKNLLLQFFATTDPLLTSCPFRYVSFNAIAYKMTASCRNAAYLSPYNNINQEKIEN